MRKGITLSVLVLTIIFIFACCISSDNYVSVRYRDTAVNLASHEFEYLKTDKSSFIRGAWYDRQNQYMVIRLNDVYYHYCEMPQSVWMDFKRADSFGNFYNQAIKGQYDCRKGHVPDY